MTVGFAELSRDMSLDQRIGADFGGHLIDESYSFYELQKEGDARVHAEKYLVGKASYSPLPIGTPMKRRPNYFLFKEENYTDIGGGYATVVRHFAKKPSNWFDYEEVECLLYDGSSTRFLTVTPEGYLRFATTTSRRGVNYDFVGSAPSLRSFGFSSRARRQMVFLCKATRYYLTLTELEEYVNNDFKANSGLNWFNGSLYGSVYPDGVGDNTFTTVSDGEGGTYEEPNFLFVNEPRWRIAEGDRTEGAIAPDSIKKWNGNIYEITRYTASLF